MAVEYEFDGLDQWEQRLAQAVEKQYPEEFRKMVIDVAVELEGRVKEHTPARTGHLRREWHVGEIEKRGDSYYIEVYNHVEYAEPVEYGHRYKKKHGTGFRKGSHMMELSLAELQKALPGYLREWLDNFLNSHDLT